MTDLSDLASPIEDAPDPIEKLSQETLGGLEIRKVGDVDNTFNLMVYGRAGIGKTVLAGSAAEVEEMSPVLFVDVEGGTLSLNRRFPQIEVIRVQTWTEMINLYGELYAGNHGYRTVVVDSLTEVQKFSMLNIMGEVIREDPSRDPEVPSIREWGKNGEQTRRFVRGFRDLPINTIFTCLDMQDRNQKTGKTVTKPSLNGKLSTEVAGFLDVVLYYYPKDVDGENVRCVLSAGTEEIVAKDRSDGLPAVLPNPTMAEILRLMTS
jgi:hypothetical protein